MDTSIKYIYSKI